MKYLFVIVAFLALTSTADARLFRNRLWSPGIIAHLSYERHMMNYGWRQEMVWRGDWVPRSELK